MNIKFDKVKTERDFLNVIIREYKRQSKKLTNIKTDYNLLGLVENAWTKDLDYYFEKYFGCGFGYYDYTKGNQILKNILTNINL